MAAQLSSVLSNGPDRAVALVLDAYRVCDSLSEYRWPVFPPRPSFNESQIAKLAKLSRAGTKLDEFETELVKAYGDFVQDVTFLEAVAAKRLSTLLYAARELYKHEPDGGRYGHLRSYIASTYRVEWEDGAPPDALASRDIAQRRSRRFDVLPREWRYLGEGGGE